MMQKHLLLCSEPSLGLTDEYSSNAHARRQLPSPELQPRDLAPLWDVDLGGRVNGAMETCRGDDEWVMSKRLRNYNFSHPLIAKHLDPEECAWAYGMNVFDLQAWRKTDIKETHHSLLKESIYYCY
ncbi:hypothetical protein F2Q69_00047443 [Brassica cretica]|uniref:Hexosyltransferase n=1 Tax=Brassica cretica TaxID=69181 RepID=A0A8S9PKZ2_BRACR|nr:hypothetical protein F2Q69_00047443 [Brassica cretica]